LLRRHAPGGFLCLISSRLAYRANSGAITPSRAQTRPPDRLPRRSEARPGGRLSAYRRYRDLRPPPRSQLPGWLGIGSAVVLGLREEGCFELRCRPERAVAKVPDFLPEQTRFEISVSPCTGPRRGRAANRHLARGPELNTEAHSFRDLPSATPGRSFRKSGTEGSNPLSSSSESAANPTFLERG
jgi:hypothetical protein